MLRAAIFPILFLALTAGAMAEPAATPKPDAVPAVAAVTSAAEAAPAERPRIDVAFCIDTTGSMQPHIDAVKQKVWDIVNGLLKGTPRPVVRLAVVAYRDKTDSYLVKTEALTEDVDQVHGFLMELRADGGGDEPEHATAGLVECVDKLGWSTAKRTLKLIYLIGDAPTHAEYEDGDYKPVAKRAVEKGINIHTIACAGGNQIEQWKEIASLSDGQFHHLPGATRYAGGHAKRMAAPAAAPMAAPGRADREERSLGVPEADGAATSVMMEGAPASAPAPSAKESADKLGDTILESIKSEAKRKGVASY